MWVEDNVFFEDLTYGMNCKFIPWNDFKGKTFFVTGSTGLIGYTIISLLLFHSIEKKSNIKIIALVRDEERAKLRFAEQLKDNCSLKFVEGDIENFDYIKIKENIDYIIHGACPTASKFFSEHPVETVRTIINGTDRVLNFACCKKVESVIFLSSMEVYGKITTRKKLSEENLGKIEILNPRSSYPESKRMAENICACYASEYGLNVKSIRMAQTFGPGVQNDDNRVFAYMIRCVFENRDIELKTSGEKENSYLYTMDAATAILTVLAKGEAGKSYNAANERTYCSIKEMGKLVIQTFDKTFLNVLLNVNEKTMILNDLFRTDGYLNLKCSNLYKLGWHAEYDLPNMYKRTAKTLKK